MAEWIIKLQKLRQKRKDAPIIMHNFIFRVSLYLSACVSAGVPSYTLCLHFSEWRGTLWRIRSVNKSLEENNENVAKNERKNK